MLPCLAKLCVTKFNLYGKHYVVLAEINISGLLGDMNRIFFLKKKKGQKKNNVNYGCSFEQTNNT